MYQRIGKAAYKADLNNTLALALYLGNPHETFKSVHVAGTNGKGSTSHMLASVLQESGYTVGLYTSPHLKDFRERIKINGEMISKRYVSSFVTKHTSFFKEHQLSFFEMTVGLAFDYFAHKKVDIAIIEVGLGGRLDSTNIILPEVAVITNIGMDHTQFLGDTLSKIAIEKAGIIKPGVPIVIGETVKETKPIFTSIASKKNTGIHFVEEEDILLYESDLKGSYQIANQKTAQVALRILREKGFSISEKDLIRGLKNVVLNTGLQGRWQVVQQKPLVICDTAHNKEGLQLTMQQVKTINKNQLHIVLGVLSDKDLASILPLFPKDASYYFCAPTIDRALDAAYLQKIAGTYQLKGTLYKSVKKALRGALLNASSKDLIYVGGSTFVVAEVL